VHSLCGATSLSPLKLGVAEENARRKRRAAHGGATGSRPGLAPARGPTRPGRKRVRFFPAACRWLGWMIEKRGRTSRSAKIAKRCRRRWTAIAGGLPGIHNHLAGHVGGGEPLGVGGLGQRVPDVLELAAARFADLGNLLAVLDVPDTDSRVAARGEQEL